MPGIQISARLLDVTGAPIGNVIKLSSGFGRDPAIAWNSVTNEFGVAFGNENSIGTAGFMAFAVVNPNSGAFVRNSFSPMILGFTYATDLDFNPDANRYIMTWHQILGGRSETRVAEMAADSSTVSTGLTTSAWPSYDALSLAFNGASGTFQITGINGNNEVVGAELNARGLRAGELLTLSSGVIARSVRTAAAGDERKWLTTYSDNYRSLVDVASATSSTNEGPGGSEGPTCSIHPPRIHLPPGCSWICWNGTWVPTCVPPPIFPPTPCTTIKPGPDWICVNGDWRPAPIPALTPRPTPTPTPPPPTCGDKPKPGPHYMCIAGIWVPDITPIPIDRCSTIKPGPEWVCVNSDWLPPPVPTPTPPPVPCLTPKPGPNSTCSNGNWIYFLPWSVGACTTWKPGPDWICVNGDWKPPRTPAPVYRDFRQRR